MKPILHFITIILQFNYAGEISFAEIDHELLSGGACE